MHYRLAILIPCVVFVGHLLLYGSWIIDDAGISFAYARSLGEGFGLVSQPGRIPVEGYSNPLWVFLMTPFFTVNLFHPVLVPKILSILLVFGGMAILSHTLMRRLNLDPISAGGALTLLTLNPAFTIWCSSGLENPLSFLLGALYLLFLTGEVNATGAGLVAAGLALTRPEGIVYALLGLLIARPVTRFLSCVIIPCGGYLLFRVLYFGSWVPNTFHMKGGPTSDTIINLLSLDPYLLSKWIDLWKHTFGELWFVACPIGAGLLLILFLSGGVREHHYKLLSLWLIASGLYLLLPADWMGEYRFATLAVVFSYPLLFSFLSPYKPIAKHLLLFFLLVSVAPSFKNRAYKFAAKPTVPLEIARATEHKFHTHAKLIRQKQQLSILLPDAGAPLYDNNFKVIDLGGLCDKTIARTIDKEQAEFYDYIFEQVKPDFIHTHGLWTWKAKLDADPRFRRDYVPLDEHIDPWVRESKGVIMYSGEYLKKKAPNNNRLNSVSVP